MEASEQWLILMSMMVQKFVVNSLVFIDVPKGTWEDMVVLVNVSLQNPHSEGQYVS